MVRPTIIRGLAAFILTLLTLANQGSGSDLRNVPSLDEVPQLRAEGPAAVDRLMKLRLELQTAVENNRRMFAENPSPAVEQTFQDNIAKLNELSPVIDGVAAARYSHQSGLYWYTDKTAALEVAAKSGKPVLSLRLLGNLNEELSCANSRFFRTILYPNEQVRQLLHDNFILHWESVRPAPVITIDFGDGRKIVRTITGNSIHYVLLPDGSVLDALPGLCGPQGFAEFLTNAHESTARIVSAKDSAAREQLLNDYRQEVLLSLSERWKIDLEKVHTTSAVTVDTSANVGQVPASMSDEAFWSALGQVRPEALDQTTRELVTSLRTPAELAGRLARTKAILETPGLRMIRNLEGNIAADAARNNYQFRRQIIAWMQENPVLVENVNLLNTRIYSQLFLTPSDNPWLGLALPDTYAALPAGGLSVPVPVTEPRLIQQVSGQEQLRRLMKNASSP